MSEPSADVSATVGYTMDKWRMDRLPWAMWACVAGLAVALHAESRGQNGAVLAVVYLALLGLAFAGYALTTLIGRSGLPLLLELLIGVLVLIIVAGVIGVISVLVGGPSGRSSYVGTVRSLYWSHLVNPSLNVFGWMMLYLGLGWIAFSSYRHFYSDRAVVSMSSAGIHFHRPWLKGLFIPWQEVRGVGHLVVPGISGVPYVSPYAAAVTVGQDFYEQHIAAKRSFFSPPGGGGHVPAERRDDAGGAEQRRHGGQAGRFSRACRGAVEGISGSTDVAIPTQRHRLLRTLVDRWLSVAGRSVSCASRRHGRGHAVPIGKS